MKKFLKLIVLMVLCITSSCTTGGHPESKEIAVTNDGTTENCEIGSPKYKSGKSFDCGTFFLAIIKDYRFSKAFKNNPGFTLSIYCPITPEDLKEGDDITDSYIEYYNYIGMGYGASHSKQGNITVLKKSKDKITLKFSNFDFTVTGRGGEKFGLNGTITFRFEK